MKQWWVVVDAKRVMDKATRDVIDAAKTYARGDKYLYSEQWLLGNKQVQIVVYVQEKLAV